MKLKIYSLLILSAVIIASCSKKEDDPAPTGGGGGGGNADSLLLSMKRSFNTGQQISKFSFSKTSDSKINYIHFESTLVNHTIKVTYNAGKTRITTLKYLDIDKTVNFTYNANNKVSQINIIDSVDENNINYVLQYDGLGNVSSINYKVIPMDTNFTESEYEFTLSRTASNITSILSYWVGFGATIYDGGTYDTKSNPFYDNQEYFPLTFYKVLPGLWSGESMYLTSKNNPLTIPDGRLSSATTFTYEYDTSNRPKKITALETGSSIPYIWDITWF